MKGERGPRLLIAGLVVTAWLGLSAGWSIADSPAPLVKLSSAEARPGTTIEVKGGYFGSYDDTVGTCQFGSTSASYHQVSIELVPRGGGTSVPLTEAEVDDFRFQASFAVPDVEPGRYRVHVNVIDPPVETREFSETPFTVLPPE